MRYKLWRTSGGLPSDRRFFKSIVVVLPLESGEWGVWGFKTWFHYAWFCFCNLRFTKD